MSIIAVTRLILTPSSTTTPSPPTIGGIEETKKSEEKVTTCSRTRGGSYTKHTTTGTSGKRFYGRFSSRARPGPSCRSYTSLVSEPSSRYFTVLPLGCHPRNRTNFKED